MDNPSCPNHGPMQKVPPGTAEQKWCGEWWRCDRCTNSVLKPSDDLQSALSQNNLFIETEPPKGED